MLATVEFLYKPKVQAKEKWVYVKRAVKGRIRMELRIREVDKGEWRAPSTSSGTGVPLVRSVSLSNWPLLVVRGRKAPPVILRESGESIDTSSKGAG
ncbi:MAG: hypothetical protein CK551_00655 [Planctomycetaceae bacterium]|nr:MAG: hypothetical protein CK551_00655 [Planctomycetaceae bacterium]